MKEEIEQKMQVLKDRWANKPEAVRGTVEYFRRKIDRMIYRELGRKLEKAEFLNPPANNSDAQIEMTEKIFEIN
jgi:hypothetical protein